MTTRLLTRGVSTPRNSPAGTSGAESAGSPTHACAAVHRPSWSGRKAPPNSGTKSGGPSQPYRCQPPGMAGEVRQAAAPGHINGTHALRDFLFANEKQVKRGPDETEPHAPRRVARRTRHHGGHRGSGG